MKLEDLMDILEQIAPLHLAASWDNVGLLLGDPQAEVRRVMTCLTVAPCTVEEALRHEADLVVTHHPIFWRPVQRLTSQRPEEALVLRLARAGTAVYSAHTAYDAAAQGINQQLAERLGLEDIAPLEPARAPQLCKLVTFLPAENLEAVQAAIFEAGGGHIGQYSQCSFRVAGTGTFFGSDATHPTVGQKGRREQVPELRLEVVCPAGQIDRIVAAMRAAHPYEEPAFDIYPLQSPALGVGAGRTGRLSQPVPLSRFAQTVRERLAVRTLSMAGRPERLVSRVGVAAGSGAGLIPAAVAAGCEVLVTGEAKLHDFVQADACGLALLAAGHYATERPGVEALAAQLSRQAPELTVWPSREETDPVAIG